MCLPFPFQEECGAQRLVQAQFRPVLTLGLPRSLCDVSLPADREGGPSPKGNVVLRSELKEEGYHLPCLRAHICLHAQGRARRGGPVLLGLPAAHPAAGRQPAAPPALLERVIHPLLRWQAHCLHHTVKDSGITL